MGNGIRPLGGAVKWWLHYSLKALAGKLDTLGIPLVLRSGDPTKIIPDLVVELNSGLTVWNRRYAPNEVSVDQSIKTALKASGVQIESFNANLLNEPWTVKTGSDQPYKVFTPYWRTCRPKNEPLGQGFAATKVPNLEFTIPSEKVEDWNLNPENPNWADGFPAYWSPGEDGAHLQLKEFLESGINGYKDNRDIPAAPNTSMLSPYLRFGEISPRQIWRALIKKYGEDIPNDGEKFLAEIGWREFSKSLLFYGDNLAEVNWKRDYDPFPWTDNPKGFKAWTKGQTGYPLVDAGMRQLWQTGWMHNRVRMVAASFLIKHLLIDWRKGEKWFWDTLVDADAASNPASWQWVAGSGADAAMFFRVFNPTLQSERFDADGEYIRKFVPELANLPNKYIHAPWKAPDAVLQGVGVEIGKDYPAPIVDHKFARNRALTAYKSLKG